MVNIRIKRDVSMTVVIPNSLHYCISHKVARASLRPIAKSSAPRWIPGHNVLPQPNPLSSRYLHIEKTHHLSHN